MLLEYGLKLNKDIKFIRRFWTIVETLVSYGFHELAGDIHPFRKLFVKKRSELIEKSREDRLCLLLEELGPTFVKFGQILSTRKDLVGEKYANALKKLTDNVEPFSSLEAINILEEELGEKLDTLFSAFDQKPLAAGSIAQVHKATLVDGTKVVVKIQRPNIAKIINEDLEIMLYLAKRIELSKSYISRFHPYEIVEEFAYNLKRELDYTIETANMSKFACMMANTQGIKVAKYFENCCTSKVLTMEYINGISISKLLADNQVKEKYDLKLIAQRGVNAMLIQVFEHAFFHADPHPGNIFICENNEVAFIDFGMMGRLSSQEKKYFVKAMFALITNDIVTLTSAALKMTISNEEVVNISGLERDIANLVDHNINQSLDKLSFASILDELMGIFDRYQLALKPSLYLMCKSLAMLENIGKELDPNLKLIDMVKPYIFKLKRKSFNQLPKLKRLLYNLDDEFDNLAKLPIIAKNILTKVEKGQLSVQLEHHHLDDIEETFYVATEHLSRALLLTALLIGSSLIIVAKIPPYWNNIPIIGAVGFLGSAFISFYVLFMDQRQRKRFLRQKALKQMEARFYNRD